MFLCYICDLSTHILTFEREKRRISPTLRPPNFPQLQPPHVYMRYTPDHRYHNVVMYRANTFTLPQCLPDGVHGLRAVSAVRLRFRRRDMPALEVNTCIWPAVLDLACPLGAHQYIGATCARPTCR